MISNPQNSRLFRRTNNEVVLIEDTGYMMPSEEELMLKNSGRITKFSRFNLSVLSNHERDESFSEQKGCVSSTYCYGKSQILLKYQLH